MNRRPLSAALQTPDLSAAALDFVKGTPTWTSSEPMAVATAAPVAEVKEPPSSTNGVKPRLPSSNEVEAEAGLVSLTVRVPRIVPPGLLLASVDRKLKRQRPWTQQELVAEALTQWLQQHGYLS